jgi:16S rRNA (guanine527-N7)-methyltransferase
VKHAASDSGSASRRCLRIWAGLAKTPTRDRVKGMRWVGAGACFTWNNEPVIARAGRESVVEGARRLGIELDVGTADTLAAFAALLRDRALPLGMVARADAERILPRHVLDSLRAVPVLNDLTARRVIDLGSGAGLPGIVMAVALTDVRFTLAESRSKRAAFLELAVERLGLANVDVHAGAAEDLQAGSFDAATARAFAPPLEAWKVARPLLRPGGSLVFFAGANEPLPSAPPNALPPRRVAREPASAKSRPGDSWRTSRSTGLATSGDLVIITST